MTAKRLSAAVRQVLAVDRRLNDHDSAEGLAWSGLSGGVGHGRAARPRRVAADGPNPKFVDPPNLNIVVNTFIEPRAYSNTPDCGVSIDMGVCDVSGHDGLKQASRRPQNRPRT